MTRVTTPAGFDVWLVSRYDDARAVLGDGESFSNVDASSTHLMGNKDKLGATPPPGILLRHDGASHSRLRLRLAREFMVKRVATLEPFIRSLVAEHIDRLASMSGPVDLYRNFGLPIPALVISEVLGVPDEDRAEFGTSPLRRSTSPSRSKNARRRELQGRRSSLDSSPRSTRTPVTICSVGSSRSRATSPSASRS
ncbi:Cytochrome P450-SU2 [Clavibacter michiganensis subsp. michiganensis]|uniref:Cytochrome P450-SU2 n=1 Tax=Clavibacter michiganensis subsp. michiganensis TaxID=33013 RepID=A0A251XMC0_CLAMM|nr:Cytochrome P450-SU2 [Clavibacter michiganensis subsp. michiganensis]OUE04591.1 Cytochrome P450-SU2 [Clavibacter michiganensis subsp. michiganensis]